MKWYHFLKNNGQERGAALLDYETYEHPNLIVLQKLTHHHFGKFRNYLDFAKYMLKDVPENKRCFYETVFGNVGQKPYFDVEFYTHSENPQDLVIPEEEADKSVACLVSCIHEELKVITESLLREAKKDNPLKLNLSHILVFTSHKEHKKSYHVIVEGFNFSDYKENKEFHDRVIRRMPEGWKNIVDHVMYKSLQQFRIVGNTKWQNNRYKTLNEELTLNFTGRNGWISKIPIESEEHRMILLLEASLITQISDCIHIICKPPEKEIVFNKDIKELTEGFNPLTPEDITEALKLCYKYAGLEFKDPRFPYNYLRTVEDNGISSLILLKRLRPSTCAICNRVHENENPFLIIYGVEREVYLDCRRNSENKKLHVGKLGPVKILEKSTSFESFNKVENSTLVEKIQILAPKPTFDVFEFMKSSSNLIPRKNEESKNFKGYTETKKSLPLKFSIY